jgi:hypothetical protein
MSGWHTTRLSGRLTSRNACSKNSAAEQVSCSRRRHSPHRSLDARHSPKIQSTELQKLFNAFRVAAGGLSAEILVRIAMVSDNLF